MATFKASGTGGELRRGYQVVAQLGPWTMDQDRVDAATHSLNEIYLEAPGALQLRLRLGRRFWVWREVELLAAQPLAVRVCGSPDVQDAT